MDFEVIGELTEIEAIAIRNGVRVLRDLQQYGKAHGIGRRYVKIKRFPTRSTARTHFVVCVTPASNHDLQFRRIYRVLPDTSPERSNFIRVIDGNGFASQRGP